jgi:hypothetical protein
VTSPQLTPLSDPTSPLFELVTEPPGLTEVEAYALLAGADTNTFGVPAIVTAAAEVHTGAMIALVPSAADVERLTVEDGEPADQLHTTLLYLGDAADIPRAARRLLVKRLRALAVDALKPVGAEGFALGIFNPPGRIEEDDKQRDTCIVLQLSGANLDQVHTLVINTVRQIQKTLSLSVPEQHRPWIPHVTLAYTEDIERVAELTDRTGPVTFDTLRIAFAGDVEDVRLIT